MHSDAEVFELSGPSLIQGRRYKPMAGADGPATGMEALRCSFAAAGPITGLPSGALRSMGAWRSSSRIR